jgi:PAS domain S-box-containing protein
VRPPDAPGDGLAESAEDLYEHAPCGYLSALPDGTLVKTNATFLTWTGYTRDELLARRFQDLLTAGGRIYHETHYAPLLSMQGSVREIALELVCADGRRLPVLVNSVLRRDEHGDHLLTRTTVFDATHRREYERELLRATARERAARERTERLQRLSTALGAAVDPRQVADAILAALADALDADQIVLAIEDELGGRVRVVGRPGLDEDLATRVARDGVLDRDLGEAMHTGGAQQWVPDPPRDAPQPRPRPGAPLGGAFAALTVLPLGMRGTATSLVVATHAAPAKMRDDDAFLLACMSQCGQALERARLYDNERKVARTLQQSLLAGATPRDPRLEIVTSYRPAIASLAVGGDWYDAFIVRDETIGLVVGDVVGRGIHAATTMGQLRSAARALAVAGVGPAGLLGHLDRFVAPFPAGLMTTLTYVELDLRSGRASYVSAGHPPPVVMQPGADATMLWDGRSAPLGTYRGEARRAVAGVVDLKPQAQLMLYTDGLVERRGAMLDAGFMQLADEVSKRRGGTLGALVEMLVDEAAEASDADDICVLAVRYTPGCAPHR